MPECQHIHEDCAVGLKSSRDPRRPEHADTDPVKPKEKEKAPAPIGYRSFDDAQSLARFRA
ncbi:hypothetical protein BIFBIF_01127 [Bifidobacterium bifidum ATCC 29521 = JCM 1255 = DSM 20456]|nr:hypothetical protein BIFBIF_01127 [Bifidobacterium bifidum ATCC 29521 = JCM 1255 = DSM 20456]